jgi:hypothetical protein
MVVLFRPPGSHEWIESRIYITCHLIRPSILLNPIQIEEVCHANIPWMIHVYEPGDQFSRTHTGIFSTCYATSQYIFISIKILHQFSLLLLLLVQEFSSYPMLRLFCYLTKTPLFILSFFQWFCFLLANTCSSNLQASLTLLITFIALIPTFTVTFLQIYCFQSFVHSGPSTMRVFFFCLNCWPCPPYYTTSSITLCKNAF